MGPVFRGCNPTGIHRPFVTKSCHPGAGRDPCPSRRGAFPRSTDTENAQIQELAERWVPACAEMAREFMVEITALLVDTNWMTASFTGIASAPLSCPAGPATPVTT